jgi:broad specificity phosphatase PhoE
MKIIFVRHGESEANVAHRLNDDPARPVSLTGQGREQAQAAAEGLRDIAFTHAYASEFPRAQQTAGIILGNRDCPLHIDARLNERLSGMDGLHVDAFNDLVRPDPLYIKPERGESFVEQMQRLRSFMDEIAERHSGGVVLAVSHENPILAALSLSNENPEQTVLVKLKNCEIVEVQWPIVDSPLTLEQRLAEYDPVRHGGEYPR